MKYINNNTQKRFALNAIMLCSGMLALSPIAAVNAADVKESKEEVEVITVTGIMSSMKRSLSAKRASDQIKDIISAEDIGQLPDQNIAEALQRITGIQIGRDFGEGNEVAVRGMSQNRVEINGQTTMGSSSESRNIQFNDLAPDAFSGIEVIKTPTADMTEGALGATINLITRKAFDSDEMVLSGRLKSEYSELSGEHSPKFSGFFSDNWETGLGRMGLALSVNYSDTTKRRDLSEVRWKKAPGSEDEDGNLNGIWDEIGDQVPDIENLYMVDRMMTQYYVRKQERMGINTSFQWALTDNLEVYFDGNYNHFDIPTSVQGQRVQPIGKNGSYGEITVDNVTTEGNSLMAATFDQVKLWNSSWDQESTRETYGGTIGFEYFYGDKWAFEGSVNKSYGEDEKKFSGSSFTLNNDKGTRGVGFYYDIGTDVLPNYGLLADANSAATPVDMASRSTFLNKEVGGFGKPHNTSLANESTEVKFDVDYDIDIGSLASIEFGVRYAERDGTRVKLALDPKNKPLSGGLADAENADIPSITPPSNFLSSGSGGLAGGSANFITTDAGDFWSNTAYYEDRYGFSLDNLTDDHVSTFDVQEKVKAAYLKANFEGELADLPYSANVGVRYVTTDLTSSGWIGDAVQGQPVTWAWAEEQKSYNDPLFSGNLQFLLTDKMVLRFAVADVMARPDVVQLAKGVKVGFADNTTGERKGKSGNPQLDPYSARQYDMSWEWYGEDNDFMSAAIFYKDIDSYIINQVNDKIVIIDGAPETVSITAPINGDGATVQGFEVAATKTFGFLGEAFENTGLSVNYTYADSDTVNRNVETGEQLPLEDLSTDSYNVVAFYENDSFSSRLAYNWRSKFLDKTFGFANEPIYTKANGQLDLTLSYKISKKIKLTFNAINLTDTYREQYSTIPERQGIVAFTGRRFALGVSIKL